MDHLDVVIELESVDDAIGVTSRFDRQFPHARAEPNERLRDIGRATIGDDGQGLERPLLGIGREGPEVLSNANLSPVRRSGPKPDRGLSHDCAPLGQGGGASLFVDLPADEAAP